MEVKMGVQITLFKALKEAKVSGENAEKVVSELEEYIAMKITEANAELIAEVKSLRTDVATNRWVLGLIGVIIAIGSATGGYIAAV
ncbi:hypothetical protein D2V07_14590 [Aurantiacibacter zhengii]|jgi:hypothetical protein|uniref:Uncharacterized protein n=3 Tax=Sphingomonadales TaxID=204457 RepID=A0A418NPN0_9SPHN|nr:hypothetical protein D2V07_14590 [Aurantiacibacter zhengii]|tara:strand:+ start:1456 stop:1713 length:258 start_codon:yes stop_codon:yes gene_type:complete